MKETATTYWSGIGRRKTAIASIRIFKHKNHDFTLNGKKSELSTDLIAPFELIGKTDTFSISAKVTGGGKVSQIEAVKLGIARALNKFDPEYKTSLKKAGLLTRDSRKKERKKPGLKRARRAPQWAKR